MRESGCEGWEKEEEDVRGGKGQQRGEGKQLK